MNKKAAVFFTVVFWVVFCWVGAGRGAGAAVLSKSAHALKKAYTAYVAGKFETARSLALAQQNSEFSDEAQWLAAQAETVLARKALQAKAWSEASRHADAAIALNIKIETGNPYSPLFKEAMRDQAIAELLAADAVVSQKKTEQARSLYERAFERLFVFSTLGFVRPLSLKSYAELCAKTKAPLCSAWMNKLLNYFPRHSVEERALEEGAPHFEAEERESFASTRSPITYRAPDLDSAAFDAAMGLYLAEKYGDAIKAFAKFADEFPRSSFRFRAKYWLAQSFDKDKQSREAEKIFKEIVTESPMTYYGYLAASATGLELQNTVADIPMLTDETDPGLQPHEVFRLKRAHTLLAEGADALAAFDLRDFKARDSLSSPFLAHLASVNARVGNFHTAFGFLGELIQRGYPGAVSSASLKMIFPSVYLDLIQKYAKEYDVDPLLLVSLIKQESAFDHEATSGSGALGLMQLMPATASDTSSDVIRSELVNPETNIRVGAKYLKKLLVRSSGNIALAVAGYNAGPGAVDRWVRDLPKKAGMLEFIESIPFKETREYVSAIVRNYYWYSHRLVGFGEPKPLSYFWMDSRVYGPAEPVVLVSPTPSSLPASPSPSPSPIGK